MNCVKPSLGHPFEHFDTWAAAAGCTCSDRRTRWDTPPNTEPTDRPDWAIVNLARKHYGFQLPTCPASTIFAGWRQSVLPVHLLGLAPLLGSVGPVAGDVKFQDDGVVHDPVNRRGGGHGVGKDALPLGEDQV